LIAKDYENMINRHFPSVQLPMSPTIWQDSLHDRQDEVEALFSLLLSYAVDGSDETKWIATIIISGCMGGNHLWQDMGLWSREDLSCLIKTNFPELAAKNNNNMKWKKYFYKQLCTAEGIAVCRSPSCEVCVDYLDCFLP